MRSVSKLFAMVVMLWVGVVAALVGCDRKYSPDDIISPKANVKLTTLNLAAGAVLGPSVSTATGNVTASSADFPQIRARLEIFNAISVQLHDYRVDYFQQDGLTPLSIGAFGGLLTQFVDGGSMGLHQVVSLSPDVKQLSVRTDDVEDAPGTPGRIDLNLKLVSDELRSFLAGPNGTFRTFNEQTTDTDDFRGLVVAQLTIRGTDINSNRIEVITRVAIGATVPIAAPTLAP